MNLQMRSQRPLRSNGYCGVRNLLFGLLLAFSALPTQAQTIAPATGYWLNPNASGSGFVIEVQGSKMFMAGFLYAANGEATWVGSVGPMTSSSVYTGTLITFSGGQTLTGAFVSPVQNANSPGNIVITFTDDSHANLTWPGGIIPIQRFDIVPGGSTSVQPATNPETGWWYNPAESGRGFAIEVQNGHMYFAGYMYDNSGNPTWYLAYGPMDASNPNLFQGEWTTFANGQTLTGPYVQPIQNNTMVGPVTLQFTNAYTATLTLPDSRQIPLVRFPFGATPPVLTAFTPAAGAEPEALMTVAGTGFDPNGLVTLNLSDSTGYSVTIPAAAVTSGSIKVSVPPYIMASNSAFAGGTVNLEATQKSNGVSLTSNTLAGFNIQALPKTQGTAGNSTLALIQADLAEAQKLQTSIVGTAQNTAAVAAAITQQVTNLQGLVTNIQNVVQNGQSYSLGTIGGVDITVTPTNIGDVDNLILAALQALANPAAGSLLKTAQALPSATCLSAEASAFAAAMTSGAGNLAQLAQNLLEAPTTSAACSTAAAFTSAFQIFGGAADVGLGIANGSGGGVVGTKLPGVALFAATSDNASAVVGLNALTSPALASQVTSVQTAIANVTQQSDPTANQLIARSSGAVTANVSGAQTVVTTVAPPATSGGSSNSTPGATGYWWNPAQPGSFFVIQVQGNDLFLVSFLYATNGEATWLASLGPLTSDSHYAGSLESYAGGQTLTGAYQVSTVGATLGSISIDFTSITTGMLTWPGGTIPIQRFDIVPGGSTATQPATNPEPGYWWNPAEAGRGFTIEVQNGTMYLAGFMYDSSGNPVWYLASGPMTNSTSFQGEWQQYGGGTTLTGPTQSPSLTNANVGTVALNFSTTSSAILTLPDGRQIPLQPFIFGN
jgi:hypothetical protein